MQLSVRTRTHVPGSPTFSGAPVLYGKSVAVLPPHRHIYSVIFEDEVFISGQFNTGFIEDFYKRQGKEFK